MMASRRSIKVLSYIFILVIMTQYTTAQVEKKEDVTEKTDVLKNFDEIMKKEHFSDEVKPVKPEAHVVNQEGIKAETVGQQRLETFKETEAERQDSESFFEGDMRFDSSNKAFVNKLKKANLKREVLNMKKWPITSSDATNGPIVVVPYVINQATSNQAKVAIAEAVNDFTTNTCVRFEPRSNEKDYLEFIYDDSGGCFADVGKAGGKQELSVSGACAYKGTIIHEMMHVLGFFHEHTRPDRDKYITINFDNIQKKYHNNFQKYDHEIASHYDAPYDYFSIMHYDQYVFNKGIVDITIVPKDPNVSGDDLGQRNGFTETDVKQINQAYCQKSDVANNDDKFVVNDTDNNNNDGQENKDTDNNSSENISKQTSETNNDESNTNKQDTNQQQQQQQIQQIQQQQQQQQQPQQSGQTNCSNCQHQKQLPSQQYPCWPSDILWSTNGYPSPCECNQEKDNSTNNSSSALPNNDSKRCKACKCLRLDSVKSPKAWQDNHFCYKSSSKQDPNFEFLSNVAVFGKRCLQFDTSKEWENLNLCYTKSAPYKLFWYQSNQFNEKGESNCLMINEPHDWSWKKKYLCT